MVDQVPDRVMSGVRATHTNLIDTDTDVVRDRRPDSLTLSLVYRVFWSL